MGHKEDWEEAGAFGGAGLWVSVKFIRVTVTCEARRFVNHTKV